MLFICCVKHHEEPHGKRSPASIHTCQMGNKTIFRACINNKHAHIYKLISRTCLMVMSLVLKLFRHKPNYKAKLILNVMVQSKSQEATKAMKIHHICVCEQSSLQ